MSTEKNGIPRHTRIDPRNIPKRFRSLIPYAEKWGISDYKDLTKAIDNAPIEELRELVKTVSEFDAEGFDEWLGNPGAANRTKDWISFVLLIDACDLIKLRLRLETDKRTAGR